MVTKRTGLWICLEGPDYSGKKAQTQRLHNKFLDWDENNAVLTVHEPTRRAAMIRHLLKRDTDAYANRENMMKQYVSDRFINEMGCIIPILHQGGIVISNRHKFSTDAYQSAQGVPLEQTIAYQKAQCIETPDLTLVLDISREEMERRMSVAVDRKERDKFEKDLDFQMKVMEQYRKIVQMAPSDPKYFGKVVLVDANGYSPNISDRRNEVERRIVDVVKPVYDDWITRLGFE